MKNFIKSIFVIFFSFLVFICVDNFSYGESLSFIQLSDIHYTKSMPDTKYKLLGHSHELLEQALKQIKGFNKIDFVIVTGDLTDSPNGKDIEEVFKYLNGLKKSWYFAFGNHDVSVGGDMKKETYIDMLKKNNKKFVYDRSYYSFYPKKNFKVIVLDGVITDRITSNGVINAEQIEWLKAELDNSKEDVVLIFLHHPIKEPIRSPGHRLENAKEIEGLLGNYKMPILVFSGHYHISRIKHTEDHNIIYVSSPSLVTYPNAFRKIEISNYKYKTIVKIRTIQVENYELVEKAKKSILAASIYEGDDSDKEATIVIDKK